MSEKYKFGDNGQLYFITFSVIHWIDLFIRDEYKKIVLDSWRYCQKHKDLEIYGWCIMTSHIHMIVGSTGRELSKIIGEMKSFTSRRLRKEIEANPQESRKEWLIKFMKTAGKRNIQNKDWQLWQHRNHPKEILNEEMFYQKLDYIHQNPVVAGFVDNEEDYVYSSARDFYNKKGLIDLCYIV